MTAVVLAICVLLYALVSRRLRPTMLTGPLIFTAAGLLFGPIGLGVLTPEIDTEGGTALLELTLVLVLFGDAFSIDAPRLVRERALPLRLLAIGLPLTIGLGWIIALISLAGLDIWEAALVAAVLAPTDASLSQAVLVDRRVPRMVRDALNVESGLNDGIVLPFVLVLIEVAAESTGAGGLGLFDVLVSALVVSSVVGALVGYLAARAVVAAESRGWVAGPWRQLALIAVALLAYALVSLVEGSGFIGAWVAGLAAGVVLGDRRQAEPAGAGFVDGLGALLTMTCYLLFGALILGPHLGEMTLPIVIFAILMLTIARLLPVALAARGLHLARPTVLFVGWFGPRGLASIVFGTLVVEEALPGSATFITAVAATVGLSVLLHGLTSAWGARRYGTWFERAEAADPTLPEAVEGEAVGVTPRFALAGAVDRPER